MEHKKHDIEGNRIPEQKREDAHKKSAALKDGDKVMLMSPVCGG